MKKITGAIKYFSRVLINAVLTPWGYKFDYLLSMIKPNLLLKKPIPWMNYNVVSYINLSLGRSVNIFEYGSGSSTLYWVARCSRLISVEHDKNFHDKISVQLVPSIQYLLIMSEINNLADFYDPASPDLFQSSDLKNHSFEKYVKSIDAFQDEYFDVVVVDGRARPSCIKRSVSKIKSGGVLIVDNSDREYYWLQTSQLLIGWPKKVFRGTVRGLLHQEQTSIYIKP